MQASLSSVRIILPLLVLLVSLPVSAQDNLGRIAGAVVDETGARIPGVDVLARDEATGLETATVSSESGDYSFPAMVIGSYTISASLPGFKTVEQVGVRVVSGLAVTLDITMPIGEVVDTVTVESQALAVDNQSSSAGLTRVVEEIEELPMAVNQGARHSLSYTRTLPGFSYDPYGKETDTTDRGYIHGVVGVMSTNIDGIFSSPANNFGMREDSGLIPEVISEFRTVANVNAEHGWNMGSSVEMVMKSGTNEFHGSLFEYFRNDVLDARQWFAADVNPHRQNEFGAVVGGRIIKDRHFFLASYTGYRERRTAGGQTSTVPTGLMRRGDFSEFLGSQIGTDVLGRPILQGQIYDPATTRPDGHGGFIRDPFPGNVIPSNRLSSLSTAFQDGVPMPNRPGTVNNHVGPLDKGEQDIDKISLKTDHKFTDNYKFSFGMDWHRKDVVWPGNASYDQKINTTHFTLGNQYRYRFSNYYTLRPNVLFSLRFAGQGVPRDSGKPGNTYGRDSGLTGLVTPDTPFTNIQGASGFGFLFLKLFMPEFTYPVYTDLTWVKGSHNYKFGIQGRYAAVGRNVQIFTNGNFTFSDITTGLAGGNQMDAGGNVSAFPDIALTGRGWASYLLGEVNTAYMRPSDNKRVNNRVYAIYLQDTWRATRQLTVNYGLRYNWWTPFGETYHRMGYFSPDIPNAAADGRLGALTFNGEGPGRNGRTRAYDRDWGAWSPRLGLAYALDDKTVLRAYAGITYANPGAELQGGGNVAALGWAAQPQYSSIDGGVTPAFNWNDGFPAEGLQIVTSLPNLDPTLANGTAVHWIHPQDNKWTTSNNFGFGIEREVGWNLLLKGDYVGKLGRHYRLNWERNEVPPGIFRLGPVIDQPLSSAEGMATGVGVPYAGFTGSVRQASRPYPQYTGVNIRGAHGGITSYHAANISAQKRFGGGLSFLLAYTLSKNIATGRGYGVFGAPGVSHEGYGGGRVRFITPYDRTHNMALTWTWQLPFGRGQRWGADASTVFNHFIGRWRIMGWHNYMSGDPIDLGARVNRTGRGLGGGVSHGGYDPNGSQKNTLNVDAFVPENRVIAFADTRQLPDIRKFGYSTENLSILKDFQVTEGVRLEFGTEIFNVFNRGQFYRPSYSLANPSAFGRYSNTALARIIQFRLRIAW